MSWHVYARIDLRGWADEAVPEDERLFLSHWRGPYEEKQTAKDVAKRLQIDNKFSHITWGTVEVKTKTFHKTIYPDKNKRIKSGAFNG